MPKCENCYHSKVCALEGNCESERDLIEMYCQDFKDKDLILELPCKVGDILFVVDYEPGEECIDKVKCQSIEIDDCGMSIYCGTIEWGYDTYISDDFGKSIFLNCNEAEKALKERKSG